MEKEIITLDDVLNWTYGCEPTLEDVKAMLEAAFKPDVLVRLDEAGIVRGLAALTRAGALFLLNGGAAANLDKPYDEFSNFNGICIEVDDPQEYDE